MRQKQRVFSLFLLSPSSRRAWIEMTVKERKKQWNIVALLAEGVDRNIDFYYFYVPNRMSPSSRRAWIEIETLCKIWGLGNVALLAEGVDRNKNQKL